MKNINRREFIATASAPIGVSLFSIIKPKVKLGFNTLSCPDWNLRTVIQNAAKMGYQGVELRGILGDMDLTKAPELQTSRLPEIIRLCKNENIKIFNLNASAVLHEYEPEKRQKNLDEAKAYIELADRLNCPSIRMFPDKFPEGKSKAFAIDTMRENYGKILNFCKGSNISVLLDAHGDLLKADDLLSILDAFPTTHTGTIWDFFNMHLKTGESAKEMVVKLFKYIKIVQIKDGHFLPNQQLEYTLTGEGDVNIAENLKLVLDRGFKGFISFEWEKRWHPELPNPEIALPHFIKKVKQY